MLARRFQNVLLASCVLLGAGCDPVRTTSQTVRLSVCESTSGHAAGNARVLLKYDFEAAEPLDKETKKPPKEWHQSMRKFWDDFPWFSAATDEHGAAALGVQYTGLDRTSGSTPPPERDEVTDKPFLVRVKRPGSPEEQLSVVMKAGEVVKGKTYKITVIETGQPRYVKTPK
jgi:hypothetical protein